VLTLGAVGYLYLTTRNGDPVRPTVGVQFFTILSVGFVILLAMITPALTSGSVSGERERKTLDLLLIAQASPLGVILGKWMGSVFYVLYLLAASLPAFALVYLFGGVPLRHLGLVLLVAAVTALTYSALGLLLSAMFKRTGVASLVAYVLVFLLVFGLPFVSLLQQSTGSGPIYPGKIMPAQTAVATPTYTYASPLTAVASVLPQTNYYGGGSILDEILRRFLGGGPVYEPFMSFTPVPGFGRVQVVRAIDQTTGRPQYGEAWAPWVVFTAISGGLTLFSLGLATLTVAPVKVWQTWRVGVRNRNAAGGSRVSAEGS
jgi:ABC-type transport system involved in multi-copper enzyme maturation permease subunit